MNIAKKLGFLTLLLAAVFLWGCDQSGVAPAEKEQAAAPVAAEGPYAVNGRATAAGEEVNNDLKALSKSVAKALADDEVRMQFFRAAMGRFDGETNVLWMDLQPSTEQAVVSAAQAGNALELSSMREVETAVSHASEALNGNLHLYWAFAENFDGSQAPWVTYTPVDLDADKVTEIVAYDASGDSHVVNGEIARERPLIVLAANERTDASGKVLGGDQSGGPGINRICAPNEDPPGCQEPPPPPPPPPPCEEDCGPDLRESGDLEYIHRFKVRDDKEGWEWLFGSEEIKYRILTPEAGEIAHEYLGSNGDVNDNNEWHTINEELFNWYHESYGDFLVVVWYEHDSGNTYTQSIPINDPETGETITTVSVTSTDEDDPMGRLPVHSEDPASEVYDTDDIAWTHRWE